MPGGGSGNMPGGGSGNTPGGGSGGSGSDPTAGSGNPGGGTGGGGGDEGPPCMKPAGEICHEFYANDNSRNRVNYVNEFGKSADWDKPVWSVQVGDTGVNSPRQLQIVDNPMSSTGKAVLVSLNKGYAEFDTGDGKRLVFVQSYSGVTGAQRLPDGTTALGTGSTIRIAGANGAEVRNFPIPGSGDLRTLYRDERGHYFIARQSNVYETNDQGAEVWNANLGGGTKGYAVFPRMGGGVYATTGAVSTIVEVDANKQIISSVGGKDVHAGLGLDFFSGFQRLPSGNFVAANWLGHLAAPAGDTPHLVEFTPDNKLVWKWGNQELARQITNVLVLR